MCLPGAPCLQNRASGPYGLLPAASPPSARSYHVRHICLQQTIEDRNEVLAFRSASPPGWPDIRKTRGCHGSSLLEEGRRGDFETVDMWGRPSAKDVGMVRG
jgi:hypothetical protein